MSTVIYWIVGIFFLLVILVTGVFLFITHYNPSTTPISQYTNPYSYPNNTTTAGVTTSSATSSTTQANTAAPTIDITTRIGSIVAAEDFIHNGITVADVENPGNYVLAGSLGYCIANVGCPSGATTTDFRIVYTASDQSFSVSLLKEPIATARQEAEQFLTTQLGLNESDMCDLFYYVETPYWVNSFYTGKNLGFSFCPGATPLPQ